MMGKMKDLMIARLNGEIPKIVFFPETEIGQASPGSYHYFCQACGGGFKLMSKIDDLDNQPCPFCGGSGALVEGYEDFQKSEEEPPF